jgi:hypothetical protein
MELGTLLAVKKTADGPVRPVGKANGAHREWNVALSADCPASFEVRFRQHVELPEDFSFVLLARVPGISPFALLRVNGDHGPHRNPDGTLIEGGPHVHEPAPLEVRLLPADRFQPRYAWPLEAACLAPALAWERFKAFVNLSPDEKVDRVFRRLDNVIQMDLFEDTP